MDENDLKNTFFELAPHSDIPKYQQLVNAVNKAVANGSIADGDMLPSVNHICKVHGLSRDTVFKAYSQLKNDKVIASVPNKGYYVASRTKKILLVLDTFKAYKEVLYHSFIHNLDGDYITDVQFHHYDIDNFKSIINNSLGKYYKYVVMNFDHKEVAETIAKLSNEKLLLIDWHIHGSASNNYVCQDFGSSFYKALTKEADLFKKYGAIHFLYPEFTDHPKETLVYFEKFCKAYDFDHKVLKSSQMYDIEKNIAYISVSDRVLANFLEQCKAKDLEPGSDLGFLSYNDTPMKKFIYKGISVVSTDFKKLGTKAAEFVMNDLPMQEYIETSLIVRASL